MGIIFVAFAIGIGSLLSGDPKVNMSEEFVVPELAGFEDVTGGFGFAREPFSIGVLPAVVVLGGGPNVIPPDGVAEIILN